MWIQLIIFIAFSREIVGNWDSEYVEGWQDVSELGFKIDRGKENKKAIIPSSEESCQTPCDCGASELQCSTLKKLLVKIPLNSLVREENEEYVELKVKFGIGELKLLKDYALENCKSSGNNIERIINKAIRNIEIIPSNKIDWAMLTYDYINQNQDLIGVIVMTGLVFLLLLWWLTLSNSWTAVAIKGFVLLFVLSSIWDWMRIYKNAIAVKEAGLAQAGGEIPVECRPTEMTFFQSLAALYHGTFTFNEDKCRKYYKLYLVDPFWDANPLTAVVDNFSRMVFHPLSVLGEYVANFLKELFSRLPIHLWVPVGIILVMLIFLFLIMYFKYRLQLPLFLGALEPGHPPPQNYQNPLTNRVHEAILPGTGNAPTVMRIEVVNNTSNATNSNTENTSPLLITQNVEKNTNLAVKKESYEENVSDPENDQNSAIKDSGGDQLLIPPGNRISPVNG